MTGIEPLVAGEKVARIAKECIYKIATGAWSPGARLPAIRAGRKLWKANQVTVLKAYKQLEAMRLIRGVPQQGFFVETGPDIRRLTRHRTTLERLFHTFLGQIRTETDLSGLGAFRFLSGFAEQHFQIRPECAFVECTEFQSRDLSASLSARLGVPCEPLPLSGLGPRCAHVPEHVRLLVTSGYHFAEVSEAAGTKFEVQQVAVTLATEAVLQMTADIGRLLVLCLDADQGLHIADDYRRRSAHDELKTQVEAATPDGIAALLEERFDPPAADQAVLLSPSLWEAAPDRFQAADRIFPYRTVVLGKSLAALADALGLPLGGLG